MSNATPARRRLTLSTEEAARQELHVQALLHQKTATWKALREVIEDVDAREKMIRAAETAKLKPAEIAPSVSKPMEIPRAVEKVVQKEIVKPQAAARAVERVAAKPVVTEKSAAAGRGERLAPGSVKVNVDELDARIAGCNLALRELEAQLDEKGPWNAATLEPLAERLKILVVRHDDLGLLRDVATKDQQEGVTGLESAKSAISQFGDRVEEGTRWLMGLRSPAATRSVKRNSIG